MTIGGALARIVPSSGNRHLEIREHLEQEGLEGFVGAVELVDQQDGRAGAVILEACSRGRLIR